MQNQNKKIILGLDHGNGNIKTAHRVFKNGVEYLDGEPVVSQNFVQYKGKYYVIGEDRLIYQGNKTDSQDFFILTLAGIAEELRFRELHEANIVLAAGLPLAWAKSQAAEFRRYLMQEPDLNFVFSKETYRVHICGVQLFPQGFAAICNRGDLPGFHMIADIGNGTMNVMQIIDNKPMEKSLATDKYGVSICMKEIRKELSKEGGEEIPEALIEPLLRSGIGNRTDTTALTVKRIAERYTSEILKRLVDYGYKEGLVQLHVIGGGGCLLKHFSGIASKENVTFIDDICANAKGYEYLAQQMMRKSA